MPKAKTYAHLTIHDAGKMTPKGRGDIARWLRLQADALVRQGTEYAPVFVARWSAVPIEEKETADA